MIISSLMALTLSCSSSFVTILMKQLKQSISKLLFQLTYRITFILIMRSTKLNYHFSHRPSSLINQKNIKYSELLNNILLQPHSGTYSTNNYCIQNIFLNEYQNNQPHRQTRLQTNQMNSERSFYIREQQNLIDLKNDNWLMLKQKYQNQVQQSSNKSYNYCQMNELIQRKKRINQETKPSPQKYMHTKSSLECEQRLQNNTVKQQDEIFTFNDDSFKRQQIYQRKILKTIKKNIQPISVHKISKKFLTVTKKIPLILIRTRQFSKIISIKGQLKEHY